MMHGQTQMKIRELKNRGKFLYKLKFKWEDRGKKKLQDVEEVREETP
jgi:hypothetical protein